MQAKVAVIGAGLGGLSAAVALAVRGHGVVVFEKNDGVGGKLGELAADGYRWDTGPTLLTMPETLRELWRLAGRELADDLTLVPLPVTCRYRWPDGTVIDEDETFWERADVRRVLDYGAGVWELAATSFYARPPSEWWRLILPVHLPRLRHLGKVLNRQSLDTLVRSRVADPHAVQILDRFATATGSSPFRAPAALAVIPYLQAAFGGWYVQGGLARIGRALGALAADLGVDIRTRQEVTGVACETGEVAVAVEGRWEPFDGIICNMDSLAAHQGLLPRAYSRQFRDRYLDRYELAMSRYTLFLGVRRQYEGLAHRNVFFAADPRDEFRDIFGARQLPAEPTIEVAVSGRTEPGQAPPGCDNWLVTVGVPATRSSLDWEAIGEPFGDRIIDRLERLGFPGLREAVVVRRQQTPKDLHDVYRMYAGSLYGFASHRWRSTFLRPPNLSALPRLCFAGGAAHPGGLMPLVIRSGLIAARLLCEHWLRGRWWR